MTDSVLPDLNLLPLSGLYAELSRNGLITRALELARDEDLGPQPQAGDVTTLSSGLASKPLRAELVARAPGVIAGMAAVPEVLRVFAPRSALSVHVTDGTVVHAGTVIGSVSGPAAEILAAERTILNLLSRLSGIATLTRRFVDAIASAAPGSKARLFDTRKTTPGLRMLEKYAVRCGGGCCHRIGLFDAVLLKDNHLVGVQLSNLGEFVRAAAARARASRPLRFVEVEVDSMEQLAELARLPRGTIDCVLLDNFSPSVLSDAVRLRDRTSPALQLEASGGITLDSIGAVARSGVDRISCGSITHSAPALDLALDVV